MRRCLKCNTICRATKKYICKKCRCKNLSVMYSGNYFQGDAGSSDNINEKEMSIEDISPQEIQEVYPEEEEQLLNICLWAYNSMKYEERD